MTIPLMALAVGQYAADLVQTGEGRRVTRTCGFVQGAVSRLEHSAAVMAWNRFTVHYTSTPSIRWVTARARQALSASCLRAKYQW
jgi:hypothetical protein